MVSTTGPGLGMSSQIVRFEFSDGCQLFIERDITQTLTSQCKIPLSKKVRKKMLDTHIAIVYLYTCIYKYINPLRCFQRSTKRR